MSPKALRTSLSLLSLTGTLVSGWLLYHHVEVRVAPSSGSFCVVNAFVDCNRVALSSFSEVFGFPIAALGIGYYLFLLAVTARGPVDSDDYPAALSFIAAVGALVALGELLTSLFVVRALCLMCSALYGIQGAIVILLVSYRRERGLRLHGLGAQITALLGLTRRALREAPIEATVLPIIILSLIAVTPAVLDRLLKQANSQLTSPPAVWRNAAPVSLPLSTTGPLAVRDFAWGDPKSAVTIVLFSDFECPYCHQAALTLEELAREFPFRLVFKNFPLGKACNPLLTAEVHRFACQAATVARCAGVTGGEEAFWRVHDVLVHLGELQSDLLEALPRDLGIATEAFDRCLQDPVTAARVREDVDLGIALKLQGTPALYLNGRRLPSSDEAVLRSALAEEFGKANNSAD